MTSLTYGRGTLAAVAAVLLLVPPAAAVQGPGRSPARAGAAPAGGRIAATPDRPSYDVALRADGDGSRWTGRQTVSFRNSARTPLRSVDLRLWGNGTEGCRGRGKPSPVRVSRVAGGTARPLTVRCSALTVDLAAPLAYGKRASVSFDVAIRVPDRVHRFGKDGAYRYLGNALPLLSVRDAKGRHLDPDVGFGESFFSLAGDFRVVLDHPKALVVPATGTTTRRAGAPGRTVTTSVARGVRDFAWAAGPFRSKRVTTPGGVRLNAYWTRTTSDEGVTGALKDGVGSVDALGKRFGRYPYGELDLVMSDNLDTFGSMEFPGLVLLWTEPDGSGALHEIAHQWFYGIVGNDQFAEPWLDEAFAQYAYESYAGFDTATCWADLGAWPSATSAVTRSMAYYADGHRSEFSRVVYRRGACSLHDLERVLGKPAMARMLRGYVRDHWLGVATTARFKRAAQAATATDLGPFWKEHRIR
ncbi:M1 family metallopeptidase [Streptomyces bambusae]|uniref:M1 family metallopeptidase n=1 Tax=Streptomyces bambusae TaxID=1550616 RepID=UPI001CFF7E6A|nr:M1 family metallopeptidase [Streptomyces bambusae]MCB5169073.1 M1 family metallopeptidase [Streptomyces bambusae]